MLLGLCGVPVGADLRAKCRRKRRLRSERRPAGRTVLIGPTFRSAVLRVTSIYGERSDANAPSLAPRGLLPIRGPGRGDILRNVRAFGAAPSGWEPVPPGCPLPLSEGVFLCFCGSPIFAGNFLVLMLPSLAPPGVTSNKGARSLVLTNSGPLRPPVRRTSAPLRCSSSPNGNGRFRWERSRSEISELSPLGGSKRYAACGDAFGRWGVVLRRGNTKSPS